MQSRSGAWHVQLRLRSTTRGQLGGRAPAHTPADGVLRSVATYRQLRPPSLPPSCQGLDAEGVDALLELLRQEQATHPGYLGGPASASQQLRQSTPPAGLSAEASEAIRQASVALFQRLGLRDCAQFSGWVLPPARVQRGAAPPAAAEQAGEPSAAQAVGQPGTPRSFAELLEVDAAERAAATGPPGVGISPADRATATDTTADTALGGGGSFRGGGSFLGGELAVAEAAAAAAAPGSTYGVYNGVVLDEATRRTNEEAVEEATGAYRCGRPLAAWLLCCPQLCVSCRGEDG